MEKSNSDIQAVVMRRVRRIYFLRAVFGSAGVSFLMFVASLYLIGREVWVARVFENMPRLTDVFGVTRFFISAFETTDVVVQALILLSILAFIWLLQEARKTMPRSLQFA